MVVASSPWLNENSHTPGARSVTGHCQVQGSLATISIPPKAATPGRVMLKDENVCVHCGLCAERCPTAAWDMQKSTLLVPYARDEKENRDSWLETRKAG